MKKPAHILVTVVRVIFGALFVYSGVLKIIDLGTFQDAIRTLKLVPLVAVEAVSIVIPVVEIVLGGALAFGYRVSASAKVIVYMLIGFTAALTTKLIEGAEVNCGCFGELSGDTVDWFTILRNLVLMGIGIGLHLHGVRLARDQVGIPSKATGVAASTKTKSFQGMRETLVRMASFAILALVAITMWALILQNQELKGRLDILSSRAQSLEPGEIAPPFGAKTMLGNDTTIVYGKERRVVLFVMKSTCKPCSDNLPSWERIASELKNTDTEVLGVSIEPLESTITYVDENKIPFRVVSAVGGSFSGKYRVIMTPQTIVIEGGKAVRVWRGAINSPQAEEILALLLSRDEQPNPTSKLEERS